MSKLLKVLDRLPFVMAGGIVLSIVFVFLRTPFPAMPSTAGTPPRAEPVVVKHQDKFQQVIELFGYNCLKVEGGAVEGEGPYGLAFRVRCTSGDFQVIVQPNNQFLVRTWANRLK